MPDTWNEAAHAAVETIYDNVRQKPSVSISTLRKELDSFIHNLWSSPAGVTKSKAHWVNLGATAFEIAATTPSPLTPEEVVVTLCRKQHDYGPENISRFGRQGLMVRMHDKVARIEHLAAHGRPPAVGDESVRDTLMDIVGYSAIGIMWENREFLLPLTVVEDTH